jgi:hypothetical protein
MKKPFRFTISGSGSGGATFQASGELHCEFHDTFEQAMMEAFRQLTNGKAVYGNPGLGCNGPYDIRRVVIEQVAQ